MATSTKRLLEQFTDGQLDLEVARREREKKEAEVPGIREEAGNYALPLSNACKSYLYCLKNGTSIEADAKEHIYKEAMEFVFGGTVHEWINKHT